MSVFNLNDSISNFYASKVLAAMLVLLLKLFIVYDFGVYNHVKMTLIHVRANIKNSVLQHRLCIFVKKYLKYKLTKIK